jgi:tetratricopeptide (TPR) repeat protein
MAIHAGPRALVLATFVALSVGFLAGYWLAPREEGAAPSTVTDAPHAVGPEEYGQLGMQSLEAGDFAAAERYFRRASEMAPESGTAHADLAVSLMYQRRWQDAHGELEIAGQLSPDTPEVYFLQGVVYRDGFSDTSRARQAWERFLAMVPSDSPQAETVHTWLEGLGDTMGGQVQ